MRHDRSATPILIALLGMALLTGMDATIKGLTAGFGTFQIVCLRFLFTVIWMGLWLAFSRQGWPRPERLKAHAARAGLMVLGSAGFFYALGKIPLAELFVVSLTAPLFITLFGALFLKEKLRWAVLVAILVGFGGMVVIVRDGASEPGSGGNLLAWAAAFVAVLSYSLSIVLLRAQTAHEPPEVIVFAQSSLVALFTLPLAILDFTVPAGADWLRFALVGLLGTTGYLCFTHALSRTTAARFSVVEYTGLLWAALFGYVFFAEVPRPAVWIGAGLIITACVLVLREKAAKGAPPG